MHSFSLTEYLPFLATAKRNFLSSSATTRQRKTVRRTPLNLSFPQFFIIHVSDKFCFLVLFFLRLVVAIQICSHEDLYVQSIHDLKENCTLQDVSISISSLSLHYRSAFECIHSWIQNHSSYMTHCSTNSGAFSSSFQLES